MDNHLVQKKRRALALISGGLDSLLAAKLILMQGIEVQGINFFTGFVGDHDYVLRKGKDGCHSARWIGELLGIKVHVVDIVNAFRPILRHPQYGYGANLNPCLDCKLFMIKHARQWMLKHEFDFLVTGEVLGQRPKSQRRDTLPLATKLTNDLVVRPLSAKLLPPTLPEREGWIQRELLCAFGGRTRNPQLDLAKKFGFQKIPQPGGGCALTDVNFCHRLQDLLDHSLDGHYSLKDILLLHIGRHFRLMKDLKVIVGRDAQENDALEELAQKFIILQTFTYPGAVVVFDGRVESESLQLAARIASYYSKGRHAKKVQVLIKIPGEEERVIESVACAPENLLAN